MAYGQFIYAKLAMHHLWLGPGKKLLCLFVEGAKRKSKLSSRAQMQPGRGMGLCGDD